MACFAASSRASSFVRRYRCRCTVWRANACTLTAAALSSVARSTALSPFEPLRVGLPPFLSLDGAPLWAIGLLSRRDPGTSAPRTEARLFAPAAEPPNIEERLGGWFWDGASAVTEPRLAGGRYVAIQLNQPGSCSWPYHGRGHRSRVHPFRQAQRTRSSRCRNDGSGKSAHQCCAVPNGIDELVFN